MSSPRAYYQQKLAKSTEIAEVFLRQSRWLTFFRVVAFLIFTASLIQYFRSESILVLALSFVGLVAFLGLLKWHQKVRAQLRFEQQVCKVYENELKTLNGEWRDFNGGIEFEEPSHDFAHDVDLFGRNSLYQLINRAGTQPGKKAVAQALSNPLLDEKEIGNRQLAISELAEKHNFRVYLQVEALLNRVPEFNREDALYWVKRQLKTQSLYAYLIWVIPALSFFVFGAYLLNFISLTAFFYYAVLPLLLTSVYLKKVNREYTEASNHAKTLSDFGKALKRFEDLETESEYLQSLQQELASNGKKASKYLNELNQVIRNLDSRNNVVGAVVLNVFLFWDVRLYHQLAKWKKETQNSIEKWIEVLAEVETLSSFATFQFNNPTFVKPQFSAKAWLKTTELGHPFIAEKERVANDFELNEQGEFVILTGANMAGKSTFLRTLAVNYILAMNGAVVCAKRFAFQPVRLITSMRTTDSLEKNESYFFTELKRLQYIIQQAQAKEKVFIILDEILKGTNSKDKEQGSRRYLSKLLELNISGIVATHDLSLCSMQDEFPEKIRNFSFDIEIRGRDVAFDYKIKKGICQNMNATILMENLGLV